MNENLSTKTRRTSKSEQLPGYIHHPDFEARGAVKAFDPDVLLAVSTDFADRYMPDDVTKDHARRMHYAAHRMHKAKSPAELAKWNDAYLALRDRIVVGNRKLIYRAVRRRMAVANRADDMIGDCHIVLIHAVAAFNPWLGIRFSTYAYTCLVRALSRMSQRMANDWLNRSVSLDLLVDRDPGDSSEVESKTHSQIRIDEFFREDHPLLSAREKMILSLRFALGEGPVNPTLEKVGESVGLSKERVRQVQATALDKLRKALQTPSAVGQ